MVVCVCVARGLREASLQCEGYGLVGIVTALPHISYLQKTK